ncbi:MAG: hypothetical protein WCV55_00420 [Candidatus Paceibacterota bacterium]
MLDVKTFNRFIDKASQSYQQFCIWFFSNNEFAKHQDEWNELDLKDTFFSTEEFTKKHGGRYKNFWIYVIASLQHGWMLGTARLFDPAYNSRDKGRKNPRLSLDFILENLDDEEFKISIKKEQVLHEVFLKSIKDHRNNSHAHNDLNYSNKIIEAGVENLYEWLNGVISKIKVLQPHLKNCKTIDLKYNEKLAQSGVEEIFEDLLRGKENEFHKSSVKK